MPMLFVQERPEDNLYARPLEGIRMKLDLWATPPAVVAFLDAQVTLTLALALTLTLLPGRAAGAAVLGLGLG